MEPNSGDGTNGVNANEAVIAFITASVAMAAIIGMVSCNLPGIVLLFTLHFSKSKEVLLSIFDHFDKHSRPVRFIKDFTN